MNSPHSIPVSRGEATREALIVSALETFSTNGFDSVSTRELAKLANVNQALIGYHFGSKKGLYLAVFEYIVQRIKINICPKVEPVIALLQAPPKTPSALERQKTYLPPLLDIVDSILSMMLSPETKLWAQLILREQSHPTEAFDYLYEAYIGQVLGVLAELVYQLHGQKNRHEARLIAIGIVGQVFVWRAAKASVMQFLLKDSLDEKSIVEIKNIVRKNITAQLLHQE